MFLLGVKNLRRNILRTTLTGAAIAALAFMITMIWTIIYFIELATAERAKDLKIIATYKWSVPSQVPMPFADYMNPASPSFLPVLRDKKTNQPLYGPNDFMVWSFYGGSTDPAKTTPDTILFFFVMEPDSIIPMMDDMNDLDPKLVEALKTKRDACLLGSDKLKQVNKTRRRAFQIDEHELQGDRPGVRDRRRPARWPL